MSALVCSQRQGAVVRLTLNNPARKNALSSEMIAALSAALDAAVDNLAVIIAAEGNVFSSGHDLKEITSHRDDADHGAAFFRELMSSCARLMQNIAAHPGAVIAEVRGLASAAGCQLVASCDMAVAGEGAQFCTPGVNIGLFCSTPMVAVSRALPHKAAMELLLTGEPISAQDARRMGLINRVVPEAELRSTTDALASLIASKSPDAIRTGKKGAAAQGYLPIAEAYDMMGRVMAENLLRDDAKEGIGAFLNRRSPRWPTG